MTKDKKGVKKGSSLKMPSPAEEKKVRDELQQKISAIFGQYAGREVYKTDDPLVRALREDVKKAGGELSLIFVEEDTIIHDVHVLGMVRLLVEKDESGKFRLPKAPPRL